MWLKKGVVEIQFNWIFILIAGAIILALFAGLILKQKGVSETSTNTLVLNNLDAAIAGSEVSAGTVNTIKIPKAEIEFGCNMYSIGDVSKQLNAMNIFTSSVLGGNSIITYTLDWSVPYRVTNLVYLVNPKTRYALVADSFNDRELSKNISDMIPSEIKKDEYTTLNVQNKNDEKVRMIFFGQNPVLPNALNGMGDITALRVDDGILEFFEVENNNFVSKGTSYYIGEETLLGAIFTDDLEIYNCVMENVFLKLNIVSQVYKEKFDYLKSASPVLCGYDSAPISNILSASKKFNDLNIDKINNAAKDLEIQNKALQKKSCVLIY